MPDFPVPSAPFQLPPSYSIRVGNQIIDLSQPKVMGILNATPDSFFAGSRAMILEIALEKTGKMVNEGADILDVGGYSTRPGATDIPLSEELERVLPIIEAIKMQFPEVLISIDTFRSEVAIAAVKAGANLVNDISGGQADEAIFETVANLKVPYVLMHIRKGLSEMHKSYDYVDVALEVTKELQVRIDRARKAGIVDILADPGFGFSKAGSQNFELLAQLNVLEMLDVPIVAGISRKSMIHKTLNVNPEEALNGTTALHMAALMKGASVLRVHDVKEARQTIQLFEKLCSPEL